MYRIIHCVKDAPNNTRFRKICKSFKTYLSGTLLAEDTFGRLVRKENRTQSYTAAIHKNEALKLVAVRALSFFMPVPEMLSHQGRRRGHEHSCKLTRRAEKMGDHKNDSFGEEASAFGQRVKGAAKDAAGSVTGNESLEREGERENAMGNARQERNDVLGTDSGTATSRARTDTTTTGRRTVHGLFKDRESAEGAYSSLAERGYGKDDINVMMSDDTRKTHFADGDSEVGSKAMEGLGAGSAIGGTVGAVLGAIAAIGTSVALPGLGLVIAGPLAAALAGAGAGSLTGGLVGALVGSGIPEEHAARYDEGIRNGGIYMGVNAREDADAEYFEGEWRDKYRGEHVYR
jgi:uncharacterized protein YjbJ (UPF0337 family)